MADGEVEIKITFNPDTGELEGLEAYLEQIRSEAEGAGDAMNGMAMMQAGQALQQYGQQAEGMAQNLNTANISIEQLATTAGQSTDKVRGMIQTITNETFSYEEATAFSTALTQMGTSFENLSAQATNLDKLNDSFHLGTQGTIQLANEMNVLGVSSNNMESSFNALAYANANTIGGMSQFKTMLQRFNVDMRDSGLNIDQAAVAIAAATHKFGGGRAAMTNFSQALKTANGDLSVLEQELGLAPGALSNASNATSQFEGDLQELADAEMRNKTIGERLSAMWQDIESQNHAVAGSAYEIVTGFGMIAGAGMQLNGLIQLMQTLRAATIGETIASYASSAAHYISAGATGALSAAQAILNAVMSMNPIILVVIALVALAAALIWAYQNVDWFRAMVDNAWNSIVQLAQAIWSYISPAIQWISGLFQAFTSQLGLNTNDWIQAIIGFILFIPQLPIQLGIALVNAIARLFGFKGNFVQTMLSTGINAVSNFINQIAQLPGKLAGELQRMYSTVSEWAATLPQKFWDAGVNAVKNFLNALGIHSPGFMFYAMQGELNRIDKVTDEADFSDNITSMGQSMANSFNPNLDFYGNSSGSGAGMNLTINIESVESEDRINQIVRAVEEALRFDNETAGRNV